MKNHSLRNLPICIFLFFLLLNSIYYTLIDFNIQFLRAESGSFLNATALSPEKNAAFFKTNVYSVHNGHYTPLIFLAEYWQSKVFHTQEIFWFWRQMIVAAVFMTSIAFFSINLSTLGKQSQKPTLNQIVIGISVAIIFGFQPIITKLVAWPFLAFQLMCLSFSAISFCCLIQFAQNENRVRLWQALIFGYLTMQIVGTGLAISLSVLFISTLLILLRWYSRAPLKLSPLLKSLIPVFLVSLLTLVHAFIMVISVSNQLGFERVSFITSGIRFGGILIEMLHASLNYLWAPGGLPWPMMRGLETDSVYGWGLVLIIIAVLISQIYKFLKAPSGDSLVRISFLSLPFLTLILIVSMIIYRAQYTEDESSAALIGYIIGARYLVFSSFFGFLFCLGLFLKSKIVFSKTVASTFVIAAIVSLAGNTTFMLTVAPEIWPTNLISHSEYWNEILDEIQSNPDQNHPNWNKSMKPVTLEYDTSTRLTFQPLIEKQLKIIR